MAVLQHAGHEVDHLDLAAEGFDPVLGLAERLGYYEVPANGAPVEAYVTRLPARVRLQVIGNQLAAFVPRYLAHPGFRLCCLLVMYQAAVLSNRIGCLANAIAVAERTRREDHHGLPWRFHGPPDGAAIPLGHAVGEFRNPQRIPRRAKAAQHVAVLITCLGGRKRRQVECRHARVHDGQYRKLDVGGRTSHGYREDACLGACDTQLYCPPTVIT